MVTYSVWYVNGCLDSPVPDEDIDEGHHLPPEYPSMVTHHPSGNGPGLECVYDFMSN